MSAPLVSVVVAIDAPDVDPQPLIQPLGQALANAGYPCEFVFVLDGPYGRVEQSLRRLEARWPVHIVQLQGGGLGESIALSAGVARAEGAYILNSPPYLQVEPEEMVKVVAALEAGADCVATWRHSRIDPWLNQLQSRLFNWLLRLVMNMPFHDLNSGTRGFRRHVLEEVAVYGELYRFLPVMARRQGFKVVEVQVQHREERGRAGFYGLGVYLRRLLDILAIAFLTRFTQRPLRFFGYLGFAAIALGAPIAASYLWLRLTEPNYSLADKPAFVIGAILAAFGVQLIGFGLVGEIIIFTQAPNLRDYKIEELLVGGTAAHPEATPLPAAASPAAVAPLPEPPRLPAPGTGAPHAPAVDAPPAVVPAVPREPDLEAPLRVRELLPGEDSRWDAFVSRHSLGTFYHLTGWSRVVREVFHHQPHHLVVEQGRRWLGVLPLFLTKSPFLGRNLVSVPYGVYGGVLADSDAAQAALLDHAAALGRKLGVGYVELRHLEPRPGERPSSPLYVTFRCDLPEDPALVMERIPKKARAEVRCARLPKAPAVVGGKNPRREAFGLAVTPDGSVEELFALFAENKRRLGSPALPLRWFQGLQDEFGKAAVIHRAIDPAGHTLAAVMSFCFKDTVYAYYSGSVTGVEHTGVNNFIYCAIMEWAVEQGYARFDFGRSRADSGPAKFKVNMGFNPEPLHYEYLLLGPGAKLPEFHPSNPRLALPRRIWSKLPMFLTNSLGARLSRFLP
ncbi:MAG: FemAB family PEP-CTERM system-associated protein [Planctomycetes bacterium]|nr:FemAB family PEP-CTERM system-associated protein [Planctomycetota bacterium]